MPLRNHVSRLLRRSRYGADHPTDMSESAASSPDKAKDVRVAVSAEHGSRQTLELNGLWREAYEHLQKEDARLIEAYENALLQEWTPEPDSSQASPDSRLRALIEHRLREIQDSRLSLTVAGKEIVVRDQTRRTIKMIMSVKEAITTAVSADPHSALAWAGVLVLLNPVAKSITQEEDAMRGFECISNLLVRYRVVECTHIEIYSNGPGQDLTELEELGALIKARTVKLYMAILRYQMRLAKHFSQSGLFRFLEDVGVTDDWKEMLTNILEIDQSVNDDLRALNDDTLRGIDSKVTSIQDQLNASMSVMVEARDEARAAKQTQLLDSLPVSSGAAFDSFEDQHKPACLQGTQVNTLHRIQTWSQSHSKENIYWLKGMAGTGKSTISRTVAAAFHDRRSLVDGTPLSNNICLGASFFFDQSKPDRNNARRIFTTLCRQLVEAVPDLKHEICESISSHPNIGNESLSNQWNRLIRLPLLAMNKRVLLPVTLIVVIDALDECESEGDLAVFIQLIAQTAELSTIRLKIFITSRPEAPIRLGFRSMSDGSVYEDELHKIPTALDVNKNTPTDDITLFLQHELDIIGRKHTLAKDWPGETKITELAQKADGLFIYAATACRFLGGANLTKSRLQMRLNMIFDDKVAGSSPQKSLDDIYSRILEFSVIGDAIDEERVLICELFRQIVGSIVVLFEPLSMTSLSEVLFISRSSAEETLEGLYSVLSVGQEETSTVQLLHLSFRDFLLDRQRCINNDFWICQKTAHTALFQNCLVLLSKTLRQDICCLSDPSTLAVDIDNSQLTQHLPVHVQYACQYWVYHLQRADHQPYDDGGAHEFLKVHFLHWLEALSLCGRVSEGVLMVLTLADYVFSLPTEGKTALREIIHDAKRFVLKSRPLIEKAPLQIYSSALIYSPEQSVIRNQFKSNIPRSILRLPTVEKEWNPLLLTLEGQDSMDDLALSPDGKLVASSTVRIWDTTTGALLKSLDMFGYGKAVAFSPDGKRIMALSYDAKVRVWDVASGILVREVKGVLTGEGEWSQIGGFSQDRRFAACVSDKTTITLIDVENGRNVSTIETQSGEVLALEFSPDGKIFASASEDGRVRLWESSTGLLCKEIHAHAEPVSRVSFSPDGKLLASVSDDRDENDTIRLWDLATSNLIHEHHGSFEDIVFSLDSRMLISSGSGGVRVWDSTSGELLKPFENALCYGLRFSPDGRFFAPVRLCRGEMWHSSSKQITVWDATTGEKIKFLDGHSQDVVDVAFSADGKILASAAEDGTIRIWDLTAQSVSETIGHHSEEVSKIILSPDRKIAASISRNIILWDVESGTARFTFDSCQASKAQFSPDGKLLMAPGDGKDQIWNTATGELVRSIPSSAASYREEFAFSPDGNLLAHAFNNKDKVPEEYPVEQERKNSSGPTDEPPQVRIWNVATEQLLYTIRGLCQHVNGLAFSPDSKFLAFGPDPDREIPESAERRLEIWDVTTWSLHTTLKAPLKWVDHITWSSDGKTLASVSSDGIRVWDLTTGTLTRLLESPNRPTVVAFSPDGSLLASASFRDIALWDLRTGTLIGTRSIQKIVEENQTQLSFSPGGETIETNMGRVDIRSFYSDPSRDLDLLVDDGWVVRGAEKALLLPYDYQARSAAAVGDTLIMGHESGRVTFLELGADV